ncbi:PspC domain-containing protein [Streptomyces albipurpureus]|uniref:PspC domain-containing protein n=1 Tax=Streptomyces albipurpureus TaxID=2897419 RepID=A0ABT0UPX6_9ACTN|nr:PspC domain-containing protein [Streptomyces sp. CWNU-1]MCM2389408.1 PspC domain-containing protein [Streptomyces sp. CWNU-1]
MTGPTAAHGAGRGGQTGPVGSGGASAGAPRPSGPGAQPGQQIADPPDGRPLRRTPRQKVLGGVCGGLGRYCDIDPVIFRIVIGVLAVTGGIGLILYGFAWLLIPLEDEEENEARRLLAGRVDGAALTAIFLSLIGCGLFLTMLNSGGMLLFAALLTLTISGAAVWSQRRRTVTPETAHLDPATAHTVSEAPPETKAPPTPEGRSWWRDPLVKNRTTGPSPTGYLWGPEDAIADPPGERSKPAPGRSRPTSPRRIGGLVFSLALAMGYLGTRLSWDGNPLGTSLQIGLVCALAVFGLGTAISSVLGRTGLGTGILTILTALLLAGAAALPKDISTRWLSEEWKPATIAKVQPQYRLSSGDATLDLSTLAVPAGQSLSTTAEVGAGRLRVVVPKDAPVKVWATADVGAISLPDDPKNDIDISTDQERRQSLSAPENAQPSGTIELRLEVTIGQVEVTRATS